MDKKTKNGLIAFAVIGLAAYMLIRSFKKGSTISTGGSTAGGGSTGGASNTTPGLNFSIMANDMFSAMNGCGTNWDDGAGDGVTGVLGKLKNQADYNALKAAYGVRTITCLLAPNVTGDIEACLKSELDSSEMAEIKGMLSAKGIQTQL